MFLTINYLKLHYKIYNEKQTKRLSAEKFRLDEPRARNIIKIISLPAD